VTTLDISVNDAQLKLARGWPGRVHRKPGLLVRLNRMNAHVKAVIEIYQGNAAVFGTGGGFTGVAGSC
jgi:hypothetical protein